MKKWLWIEYLKLKSLVDKDTEILVVDVANNSTMTFKNGSVIETALIENDTIRGRRSELLIHYDDFEYNKEDLDEVLNDYVNK